MGMRPCGAEDGILPIGSHAKYRRVAVSLVGFGNLALRCQVVVIIGKLAQVHDVETIDLPRGGHRTVVGELGLAAVTFLRGDEHHAVGTLRTVDGRGRGILEHFHAHNVGGVEQRERRHRRMAAVSQRIAQSEARAAVVATLPYHAVDHIERVRIGIDRGQTADVDRHGRAGRTRGLHGSDTRYTPLQGLVHIGNGCRLERFLVERGRGTGQVALLHHAIAHHNDLVQGILVFRHVDGVLCPAIGLDRHRAEAHVRNLEHRTLGHPQREVAVQVGDRRDVRTLHLHRGTDDGSLRVGNGSTDLPVLLDSSGKMWFATRAHARRVAQQCQG